MVLSAILRGVVKTDFTERFHENMLAALGITFLVLCAGGVLFGSLFRFSAIRAFLPEFEIAEKLASPESERRLTLTFCLLLLLIVGVAVALAATGVHA